MSLRAVIYDVWILGIGLQTVLALVLLGKRAWQRYPVFSAYVFLNLFGAALSYAVFQNKIVYFYAFWICEAVGIILGLGVVREIFTNVFSPHPALRRLAKIIFRVAVVGLVVLAVGAIYAQSGNAKSIPYAVLLAAQAARIVEVGLIMFLFLCSSAFGLHWRQNVFGMALGLGMIGAVELVTVTLMPCEFSDGRNVEPGPRYFFFYKPSHLAWLFAGAGAAGRRRGAKTGPVGAVESGSDGANK